MEPNSKFIMVMIFLTVIPRKTDVSAMKFNVSLKNSIVARRSAEMEISERDELLLKFIMEIAIQMRILYIDKTASLHES
jgi:hypothetical protein